VIALAPAQVDAWFALGLVRQDLQDAAGATEAFRQVLRLAPGRADAAVNLGIVLQDSGDFAQAMQAYRKAYHLRQDTFGRIATALTSSAHGALWCNLDALRAELAAPPA